MRIRAAEAEAPELPRSYNDLASIQTVRRDWWARTEHWLEKQILLRRSIIGAGASTCGNRMIMRAEIVTIEEYLARKRRGEKHNFTPRGPKGGNRWRG